MVYRQVTTATDDRTVGKPGKMKKCKTFWMLRDVMVKALFFSVAEISAPCFFFLHTYSTSVTVKIHSTETLQETYYK